MFSQTTTVIIKNWKIQWINKKIIQNKSQIYSQIISTIFQNLSNDTYSQFLKYIGFFYSYSVEGDVESIDLLTRKRIIQNKSTFILNEKEKTAILSKCNVGKNVEIPKSVSYKSQEYIITNKKNYKKIYKKQTKISISQNRLSI